MLLFVFHRLWFRMQTHQMDVRWSVCVYAYMSFTFFIGLIPLLGGQVFVFFFFFFFYFFLSWLIVGMCETILHVSHIVSFSTCPICSSTYCLCLFCLWTTPSIASDFCLQLLYILFVCFHICLRFICLQLWQDNVNNNTFPSYLHEHEKNTNTKNKKNGVPPWW